MTDLRNPDDLVPLLVDIVPRVLDDNGLAKASSALTSAIVVDICKAYGIKARPQPCDLVVYRADVWEDVVRTQRLDNEEKTAPAPLITSRYVVAVVEGRMSVDLTLGALSDKLPRAASYEEALTRNSEMAWVHGEFVVSYAGNTDDTFRTGAAWKGAHRRRIAGFVIRQLDSVARHPSQTG